ncbi:MAG: hypothetical protein ACRCXB_22760 [Aeromonadaceae bacterium]
MGTIKVMCRETGKTLEGIDSLRQRLGDCLSFPKNMLVGRRDYGIDLLELVDRNMTPTFSMDVFMVVSEAINDPVSGLSDFSLTQVGVTAAGENHLELVVVGDWAPSDEPVTLEGVRIGGN